MKFDANLRPRLRVLEVRTAEVLRSRTARVFGTLAAFAALAALGARLLEKPDATVAALQDIGAGGVLLSVFGLVGFHVAAIRTLGALEIAKAPQIWAQAQLLKYLPVPGSALAGFVGSALQHGHRARQALRGLVLHTLVLMLGATVASGGVLVSHGARLGPAVVSSALMIGTLIVGLGTFALMQRANVPPRAFVYSLGAWSSIGLGFGIGLGGEPSEWLGIGAAYAAAWVIGQLAVPVPAGLGIREAVFVLILTPIVGDAQALVAALLSRVLHALSDGGAAAVIGVLGGWRRRASSVEPDG